MNERNVYTVLNTRMAFEQYQDWVDSVEEHKLVNDCIEVTLTAVALSDIWNTLIEALKFEAHSFPKSEFGSRPNQRYAVCAGLIFSFQILEDVGCVELLDFGRPNRATISINNTLEVPPSVAVRQFEDSAVE